MSLLWVSRYLNRANGNKILHAFGETDATASKPAQGTSFCGRIELSKCEHRKGELFPAERFGGNHVDHCISCERTVARRRRFA